MKFSKIKEKIFLKNLKSYFSEQESKTVAQTLNIISNNTCALKSVTNTFLKYKCMYIEQYLCP